MEVVGKVRNCLNNPRHSRKKIAELLARVHVERFDREAAEKELSEYPGRFSELFGDIKTGSMKLIRIFEGHESSVTSVSLSVDGRYALSGSEDKTLKLWEAKKAALTPKKRQYRRTFEGHGSIVSSVSLSADGRYVVSGSWDKTVKLWEVEKGQCLQTFEGQSGKVYSVRLSADGRYAVSGSEDGTIKLLELIYELKFEQ